VPTRLFVGGRWQDPVRGQTLPVRDPATESIVHYCPLATAEDVDLAVAAAQQAFASGVWSKRTGAARAVVLEKIADGLMAARQDFARIESIDNGKPLGEAAGDVDAAIECFRYYAAQARALDDRQGEPLPVSNPAYSVSLRWEPVGVAAAITPWNYPLLMAAWKIAPALAAGCSMVLKPSEVTPLSALRLAEVAAAAGVPLGVLSILPGLGAEAGRALSEHPGIAKVAFTGGTATGTSIMRAAADRLVPVTLELGGKSAAIVFADADLDRMVDWLLYGAFGNAGQICSATSRVLVHEDLAPELEARLAARAQALCVGAGGDPGVQVGPLVSSQQQARVMGYIERGKAAGARLVTGGGRPAGCERGYFLEPTIFADVTKDMDIWREEIFGPVLCLMTFRSEEEAILLANDSAYGLAGAVMTRDEARLARVSAALEAGIVWQNASQASLIEAPWGGCKASGVGRELGRWGLENYLRVKQVTRHVAPDAFRWEE
jgi:betaine-aldehyde dehydrogenase